MLQVKKKYKAIIFDCDGTLVPNRPDGMPSLKVMKAIKKANNLVHIGIATSRPLQFVIDILKKLNLKGPSIISGGAQIIDGQTLKVLKVQYIEKNDLKAAAAVIRRFNLNYWVHDGEDNEEEITTDKVPERAIEMAISNLEIGLADQLHKELLKIDGLAVHKVTAWEKNKNSVIVTHISASKLHGALEVARMLGISTHEMIGVGDSYNDFPLLMACGLKVAMGNAVPDLKAIADYIAPSVEDDGVVDVINKYIL